MNVVSANSSKKSRCWSLIFHQWFFAWLSYCLIKDQF